MHTHDHYEWHQGPFKGKGFGPRGPHGPFDGPHEHHGPHGHGPHGHHGPRHMGPQTFRRGRAIEFLNRLETKKATLKQQLEQPELASIREVISGELKAVESIIDEFMQVFDFQDIPTAEDADQPDGDNDSES